jgi:hypothetical protein
MKKIMAALTLAGALMSASAAPAQTAGAPLQVRTGEEYAVRVEVSQAFGAGETQLNTTMTEVFSLRIVDAEARLWRYTPVAVTFSAFDQEGDPALTFMNDAMSAFLRIGADIGFECRVDEFGACQEMTNWPVWRDRVENTVLMMDAIARWGTIQDRRAREAAAAREAEGEAEAVESELFGQEPEEESGDALPPVKIDPGESEPATPPMPSWEEVRVPVLAAVARLLDHVDARDAGVWMRGVYLPAGVQGRTLTRRQAQSFVDEMEMPLDAPPVRFNGTLQLDRIDRRNNTAIVVRRASMDPESLRASIRGMIDFVDETIEPLKDDIPNAGDIPEPDALVDMLFAAVGTISYEETATGIVDLATGMAREATTEYVIRLQPAEAGAASRREEGLVLRGRVVTQVSAGAPDAPRLQRAVSGIAARACRCIPRSRDDGGASAASFEA